jgi:hypothetical protein
MGFPCRKFFAQVRTNNAPEGIRRQHQRRRRCSL